MKYDKDAYQEHLAALEAMRTEVESQLTQMDKFTIPLLVDSTGPIPSKFGHKEPDFFSGYRPLRVDLSKGTVTLEHRSRLNHEHKLLTEMNVPHTFSPAGKEIIDAEDRNVPASITLSVDDALQYLPTVIKRARALETRNLKLEWEEAYFETPDDQDSASRLRFRGFAV